MAMVETIADYFDKGCGRCPRFATPECSTRAWAEGLAALRRICLDTGLTECVKWGHPCYRHAGRNIAIIGAHRHDFCLSMFNAALLADPAGLLEKSGPNSAHADLIRFTANGRPAEIEAAIRALLCEAMAFAEAGIRPGKSAVELNLPEELVAAMDDDPVLAEAFHVLTPGRQHSHVIALSSAKTAATRHARVDKLRERIISGKGANER